MGTLTDLGFAQTFEEAALDFGPFGRDDGEHDSVGDGAIGGDRVISKNPFFARAEFSDRAPALKVARVGFELNPFGADFKRMTEEKELCLGVDPPSLPRFADPSHPNLQGAMVGADIHVCGTPDRNFKVARDDGEGDDAGGGAHATDIVPKGGDPRTLGLNIEEIAKGVGIRGRHQALGVAGFQRLQADEAALEYDGLDPGVAVQYSSKDMTG